jgi:hypothetical protein
MMEELEPDGLEPANGVLHKAVDVSRVLTRAQSPCSYKRCPYV